MINGAADTFELREVLTPYGKADNLDFGNTFLWDSQPPSINQFLHGNGSIKAYIQLATLHFAKTKAVGLAKGELVALDDDDWCGTPPRRPWPWPWPRFLLDLVKVQMEVFKTEVLAQYQLTKDEVEMLDADLNAHYKDFFMLLK